MAAREKIFKDRRATRNAEWEKKKKGRPRKKERGDEKGDAKIAKQNQHMPVDDTDELAASQLFGGQNKPILLDLAEVMQGGSARFLMAKASPGLTSISETASSVTGSDMPSLRSSAPTHEVEVGSELNIYVIGKR